MALTPQEARRAAGPTGTKEVARSAEGATGTRLRLRGEERRSRDRDQAVKVAFQMDHIARIRIRGDSTFALMLEGQARGHALFHFTPDRLALRDGRLEARVEPVTVRDVEGDHFALGEAAMADLASFDVVHLRQDPPFDMGYITTTHLLQRLHPKTLVVKDPAHVRNAPGKRFF